MKILISIHFANFLRITLTSSAKIASIKEAAKVYFGIITIEEKVAALETKMVNSSDPMKIVRPMQKRITPQRPLMVKPPSQQHPPLIFCLTSLENDDKQDKNSDTLLNSYQKAKLKCADKFKCNICGKGFPLSCLLRRHLKTHSDTKPFKCNFCLRTFSSKASCRHHLFMKHAEEVEQSRKNPIAAADEHQEAKPHQLLADNKESLPIEIIGVDLKDVTKPGTDLDKLSQESSKNIDSKSVENNMYYWI